jgi:FMN phosphatase YigB (HAD superfamily)
MPTPRFFYFDLGNVLLHFEHSRSARQMAELAGCSYEVAWEAAFGRHALETEYESGRLTSHAFHARFCDITGTTSPREAFLEAASAIFTPVWGCIPLVAHLFNAGYPLGILSNTCEGHWEYCRRHYPFLNWYFPVTCLSFEVGAMKPDRQIYAAACAQAGLAPAEIFFVDDRADNVAAARAMGMDAVLFDTPRTLARDLYQRGVHTNY